MLTIALPQQVARQVVAVGRIAQPPVPDGFVVDAARVEVRAGILRLGRLQELAMEPDRGGLVERAQPFARHRLGGLRRGAILT